jgi:hypothetical protein
MNETKDLAIRGLNGWHLHGTSTPNCTYSVGPYYEETPPECRVSVDMREVYERADNAASMIWKRPNLDLGLPADNVRDLFEGCIGHVGTTKGHSWDGKLESLTSMTSVGLNVYLAILEKAGGIITRY